MMNGFCPGKNLYVKWFFTSIKVNMRTASFYLLTVLMTAGLILSSRIHEQADSGTRVLISPGASEYCLDHLGRLDLNVYTFDTVSDTEELIDMIRRSEAACGIVLNEENGDVSSRTAEDELIRYASGGLPDKPVVTIYQSPGNVDGYVMREILYPALARYMADMYLEEYISGLSGNADAGDVVGSFDKKMDDSGLRLYEVVTVEGAVDADLNPQTGGSAESGVLIFLSLIALLLITYDTLGTDREFYGRFKSGDRAVLRGIRILTSIIMSTGIALILSQIILY